MRPLELTIQGFKSYRDKCTFNFEGRGLFGIVGPTGAGKSSILDALIFCLYGKTPRLERETKKLINSQEDEAKLQLAFFNSQEDEAKLQLAFEMDEVGWRVTRVIRRKGQSQVLLERIDGGADQVAGDRNVNERLPQILGLNFGAFCASVCLSQGEFDRFLSATPSERVQILKGVFALDKVDDLREAAKGHSRLLNDQIRIAQGTLEALPEQLEAGIEESQAGLAAAREQVDQIRAALPAVAAAEAEVRRSAEAERAIALEKQRTEEALDAVPPDGVITELVEREDRATRQLAEAESALLEAEAQVAQVEEELAEIEKEGKGWDWCSQVEAAIRARTTLTQEQTDQGEKVARAEAALRAAASALAQADKQYGAADTAFSRAKVYLEEVEHRHAAHILRSGLKEGAPCPVCDQTVSKIPVKPALPALQEARGALEQAERSLTTARETLERCKREEALAQERLSSACSFAATLANRFAEISGLLSGLVGDGNDAEAVVREARRVLEQLKTKGQKAASARQGASQASKRASDQRNEIAKQIHKMATMLSGMCGRLGLDADSINEEGLRQTAKRLSETGRLKLDELDRRAEQLSISVADARFAVAAFRERFGAAPNAAPAEILGQAISRVQRLEGRLEDLGAALVRRIEAERQVAELSRRKALYDRLSTDLTDARFTAYLLTEQTRLLCELASEKFQELTGYYTFDFDAQGNITVVDERTGAVRSPQDTLSGGESFLASLSLALALAETVANRGGRLECFFLDEGFGSLDAEALDRALEGIQMLAEPGRMIALISHVGGIQSQLEDLIVLERNNDGSTSVVQDGGPIAYLPAAI